MDDIIMHSTHHERQEQRNRGNKLLTSIFSEAIYGHLSCQELLPNEQKGCKKNSRGTKDQLLIDKTILENC